MGLWRAAAVLLETLLGPSVLSVVCDVTCVHHEHHVVQAAAEQSCHEQGASNHGPALVFGGVRLPARVRGYLTRREGIKTGSLP